MTDLKILFIDSTLRSSPELSELDSLWRVIRRNYQSQQYQVHQIRLSDLNILPGTTLYEGQADQFPKLFQKLQETDILILGTPVIAGNPSSLCQRLLERLQGSRHQHRDPMTGHYALLGKVLGLILSGPGDGEGLQSSAAALAHQLTDLGLFTAPHYVACWRENPDMHYFDRLLLLEQTPHEIEQSARLLAHNSIALAYRLQGGSGSKTPFAGKEIYGESETTPILARMEGLQIKTAGTIGNGIDKNLIGMRTWILMQEGIRRGYSFEVIMIRDAVFKAIKGDHGFIFEVYPGHIRFRRGFEDYNLEKSKALKLIKMSRRGLPIPKDYGTFSRFLEIPINHLEFPLVVKPDEGSLSENVFVNLRTMEALQQAALTIELLGKPIKLESHISGQNYRLTVIAGQYAGCVERRPANVVGDGQHTIQELFHLRNQEPGRGDRYAIHTTNHQLVFDQTSRFLLEQAEYTLDTILPKGEIFSLQTKILASLGADYIDVTDSVHSRTIEMCLEFAQEFSTLTLGLDLITTDIALPLEETGGAFNEYNFLPYLDIHEKCNIGKQRAITSHLWDYIEAHEDEILTQGFTPF